MVGSKVGGQIKTRVDELIALIAERSQISAPDAAKELSVDQEMVESWARFLEKSGDIKIIYKGLTPTFFAADETPVPDEAEEKPKASGHAGVWKTISGSIGSQIEQIRQAVTSKAYERVKPALTALTKQLEQIRERLAEASLEEQDRKALEQSIERVSGRIESVGTQSSKKRARKLKSESDKLAKDVEALTKRLNELPQAPVKPEPPVAAKPAPPVPPAAPAADLQSRIDALESEARTALESGDVEHAEEIRERIESLYEETLPQRYEALRSHMKDRIYALKRDLTFASDVQSTKSFEELKQRLEELLGRYGSAVDEQRWSEVESLETDIIETYDALPRGYESEKERIEERFGSKLIEAAKLRRTALNERIAKIRSVLEQGKQTLAEAIGRGDFSTARDAYAHLRSLLDHIPEQLVIERIDIQRELLEEFERLTSAFKERFIARNEELIERCTHLIETVKRSISEHDPQAAQDAYDSAYETLSRIDHNYFEQRSRLQYDLMRIHKNLLDIKVHDSESEFERVAERFQQALTDGRTYIVNQEPALAESIYLKLLDLYRALPAGNEDRREAFKNQISDYYADLQSIKSDTTVSSTRLDDVLERLVSIHHDINTGNPSVLSSEFKRVEQLVEALPDTIRRQNPTLEREIVRLSHLRRIYEKAIEANRALDEGTVPSELRSFLEGSERWMESENVSASSIAMTLRELTTRLDQVEAEQPTEPALKPEQADPMTAAPDDASTVLEARSQGDELADLTSRIEAIKSLLKE